MNKLNEEDNNGCIHTTIFSEGFEVCFKCGYCIQNSQEYFLNDFKIKNNSPSSFFEHVLINNNIYYSDIIQDEYLKLKLKLCKKISNVNIFAYCTYDFLRKKFMFRSLDYIAQIFYLDKKKFKKACSKIFFILEINEEENIFLNDEFYFSQIVPFLRENNLKKYIKEVLACVKHVKDIFDCVRPNIIAASCIFYFMKEKKINISLMMLCNYFCCSHRVILSTRKKIVTIFGK